MNTPTLQNLQAAIGIQKQIDSLQVRLSTLLGSSANGAQPVIRKRRPMSKSTKLKLAAIQKKRWARYRQEQKQRS